MKTIELALQAGKKRQSPLTGFIHYFPQDSSIKDTIPLYENFCFALALFRTKTTESVLEGKNLIEKLLAFQLENGNFPLYLHDFPKGWDFHLGLKIAPVLFHILEGFSTVLPASFKEKVQLALQKTIQKPENPIWNHRIQALLKQPISPPPCMSSKEWFEWIISDQIAHPRQSYAIPYHPTLQLFLGPHLSQEKEEPEPVALEYILAEEKGHSLRLQKDHIHQLHSALLFPFSSSKTEDTLPIWQTSPHRILWKGTQQIHSLHLPKGTWDGNMCTIHLEDAMENTKDDLFEALFFVNLSPETSLFINGQKGMIFQLKDCVSIKTPHTKIDLVFSLIEGEGSFCGHIFRGNRPHQISAHGKDLYEAYDWQIGLRVLQRKGPCTLQIRINTTN